ncbi:EAL domain-containing protein [Bradyrhizobium sp.]|uniref:bifunctional diguanylate cyclase/phosphodiesterase n=1 Tax=Bradyrhizobium sp. TaxID=376 RepID=UPI0039E5071A
MPVAVRSFLYRLISSRPITIAAVTGICLAVSITIAAMLLVRHLRDREISDNTSELATYATLLSAHLESSFAVLEAVQDGVLAQLRADNVAAEQQFVDMASTSTMHTMLTARVSAIPFIGGLTLVDNRGMLVNSTYYWPMPYRDLSDREYFHVISSAEGPDRFVTQPLVNRANGEWTIYVARRITSPTGVFLGVLLGEMRFSYFARYFSVIAQQPDAVVSMFDLTGVLLVRHPEIEGAVGTVPNSVSRQLWQQGRDRGTTRGVSAIDGMDRIFAFDRLPHYPIIVSISRSIDAVLAPLREQQRFIAFIAVLLDLAVVLGLFVVFRYIKGRNRLKSLEASLVKAEIDRAVATENRRFTIAVNAMAQCLIMFDRNHRLIVINPSFREVFGLSPERVKTGCSLAVVVRAAIASGSVTMKNVRRLKASLNMNEDASEAMSATWDINNHRSLLVGFDRSPDDGCLMTAVDITERRRAEAQIFHMARHDGLTGLKNRTEFRERLDNAVRAAAQGLPHAVLFLDLDYFKNVNDTWGHQVGDALLQAVTSRIRRCCRTSDSIARLGGDEFAIIQPLTRGLEAAEVLCERIVARLSRPFEIAGHQLHIGCSIGVALAPDDGTDAESLLKCADLALYKAKADGRNCFRFFEPQLHDVLQRRRVLDLDLRYAMANHEIAVFYQPLINAGSGRICAFEALLRWRRADGSFVSPSDFIPAAEKMGLIHSLGQWALATACRQAATWPAEISIAVNLSPVQFARQDLVDTVRNALTESGLAAGRLQLEITEGSLLEDVAETLSILQRLRELGVSIAMDDFGTGYSSLSYLLKFPFDKVKLDRSLIAEIERCDQSDVVLRSIITMCNGLGMRTTGEGVETEAQLAFLERHSCTEAQGFLISKAVPGDEVPALLAQRQVCEKEPDVEWSEAASPLQPLDAAAIVATAR